MPSLRLERRARRAFDRLPSDLRDRIAAQLTELAANPRDARNTRALKEPLAGWLRTRVGDWRIVWRFDSAADAVVVSRILPRDQVYR